MRWRNNKRRLASDMAHKWPRCVSSRILSSGTQDRVGPKVTDTPRDSPLERLASGRRATVLEGAHTHGRISDGSAEAVSDIASEEEEVEEGGDMGSKVSAAFRRGGATVVAEELEAPDVWCVCVRVWARAPRPAPLGRYR